MNTSDSTNLYEHNEKFYNIELPVAISENTLLIRLGVEFGPFAQGDEYRQTRLPEGWVVERINKIHSVIKDNNNSERASIYLDGKKYIVQVHHRFSTGIDKKIPDSSVRARFCVWDAKKKENKKPKVVFEVNHAVPNINRNKQAHKNAVQNFEEKRECLIWLEENFPDWENPFAYWEEE